VDLNEIGCDGSDWVNLAQDKSTGVSCEHGNARSGSTQAGNFLTELLSYSQEVLCSMWLVGWLVG
jgi:hypothetical protein